MSALWWLQNLPIQRKLIVVGMLASGAALVIASVVLMVWDLTTFSTALERDLRTVAAIIADNTTAALSFRDNKAAAETLTALRAKPNIRLACIYDDSGQIFASYILPDGEAVCPSRPAPEKAGYTTERLVVYQTIVLGEKTIGTVYIESGLDEFRDTVMLQVVVSGVVLILVGLVAFLISSRLGRLISGPVLELAQTAESVSKSKDFSLRAAKQTNDEVGQLVDAFNHMLLQISERDQQVLASETRYRELAEERARLLEAERTAREQAEEANRLKDEFLATVSHELRTPLTAILGWAKLLRSGKLPAERVDQAIEVIDRNAKLENRLIDDLLDTSRVIAGMTKVDGELVDVLTIVQTAVESILPSAEAKGLTIATELKPVAKVFGNAERLQQVFWNVLSNSVKFTPSGGKIFVAVGPVNRHVEVKITDTGIGIDPAFLPHVFERFRQADSSATRKHGGLGLGLAIVRHLAELHNGTVEANSQGIGHGATFTVRLPVASPEHFSQRKRVWTEKIADRTLDGFRALVVEDEEDTRQLIARILEDQGAVVSTADSYHGALEVFNQVQPHVLLLDIGMPDHSGYELLAKIRSTAEGKDIPAVAVTAYATQTDQERAMAAGFNGHVAKPFAPEELIRVVADAVQGGSWVV